MEFDLSVSQVNELLANIGKETELARRLSSHALTNGSYSGAGSYIR